MAQHNELGVHGEKLAINFLESKGYSILEKNWRFKHEEIDLITKQGAELVIVEVKTRTEVNFDQVRELISESKIRHLIEAAEAYIMKTQFEGDCRFDVILISNPYSDPKFNHIEHAFMPEF